MKKILFTLVCLTGILASSAQTTTVLFDFASTSDQSGQYGGALKDGASITKYAGFDILDLGTQGGWFQFDEQLAKFISQLDGDFTISTNVFLPSGEQPSGQQPVLLFSGGSGKGALLFDAASSSYTITSGDDATAETIQLADAIDRGVWNNIVIVRRSGRTTLYVNKSVSRSTKTNLTPASVFADNPATLLSLGLGLSGETLRGAKYADFLISDFAATNIPTLREGSTRLNAYEDSLRQVQREYEDSLALLRDMHAFTLGDVSALADDIYLPRTYKGRISIAWATSDSKVINTDGHITRPAAGSPVAHATLTAYLSAICLSGGRCADTLQFVVGVIPEMTDAESVDYAISKLQAKLHLNSVYGNIALPSTGEKGTTILWKSDDPEWLTDDGRVMKLPAAGEGFHVVNLTATVIKNGERKQQVFPVRLHEEEPYSAYLFVYFPSNADENIYYALSTDGYNYTPINNGRMVVSSDTISLKQGVRDPHILRAPDGMFYMVCTDMRSAQGWESNRGIVMMKSPDLIHWTHSRVNFPDKYYGTMFAKVSRVWAPETIWDPDYENADGTRGRLMVYFSILTSDNSVPYDKDYYCYANDDFTDLLTTPTFFYDRGSATIDMDIVFNEADSLYHGFYKNEGQGGICKVTASRLTPLPGQPDGSQWSKPSATLQQTTERVEGAGVFKRINSDEWILMYDCYDNKHYQFCSSTDLENFTFVKNTETTGAFTPRHGTVLPITPEETRLLLEAFPNTESTAVARIEGTSSRFAQQDNILIQHPSSSGQRPGTVTIPVSPDVDLTSFDPQLLASVGCTISPTGPQDFTHGAVLYTITPLLPEGGVGGGSGNAGGGSYNVTISPEANPVIPGFHADPEVLFSQKTGRFYIYPTTDGYEGWGGYSFDVFSSPDLVHFTNEGTFLDLATSQVQWATGNAWAPCIEEKWMDGAWKYFFYFSGQNSSLGRKTLGVATADSPTGPFKASSAPLFTETSGGQMIDSDVFTDPVSGQTYFYYGNSLMHYRLLSDDMLSVGPEYTITPTGGTLADYAFREGTYVFYRNGIYYFLWSVDDTGATNYHVAYGTSTRPTGPIRVADEPIVIIQDPDHQIYGTGHNSILNIPGTDDWYIVYHRINRSYLNNGPGIHREVCIDRLTFNPDGTIQRVTPTRRGITPVSIDTEQHVAGIHTPLLREGGDRGGSDPSSKPTYYTLSGRSLGHKAPTAPGIYIRREVTSDGQVRTMKIVKAAE